MTPHQPCSTRRRFLVSSIATGAAMGVPAIHAGSKTSPAFHGAVIGHGDRRYRVDKLWCQADRDKHPVNDCHEMVQASDGRLFLVTNHRKNNILVFGSDGNVIDSWTLNSSSGHGLTIAAGSDSVEHLYVTCNDGKVVKTTLDGEVLLTLPTAQSCRAYKNSQSYTPTETAVNRDGNIYVADGYGSQFILKFNAEGQYESKFGGKSTRPIPRGKFLQAHGVAVDNRGEEPLLVCTERVRNEFNWFTMEGEHVKSVYLPGAYVSRPVIHGDLLYSGVCFGGKPGDHRMYTGRGFVTILDRENQVISNPGGTRPQYDDEGRLTMMLQDAAVFENCHDVCVDAEENLYVCQWNSNHVYPYKLHREA
ncbi:NHL repeat-containing protein [Neorhodopirellula lusitana]|uniref:6-bladed beta-propeller n=1 Tax=Neorhodopirellula lusitana TaxID=445327 RepID=UPI00384FEBF6